MTSELEKIAIGYGDECLRRKKARRQRQKTLVLELFFEYAKNSTLHGFRYIVDQGLTLLERVFWFLTVIGSILLCLFYIYNVIMKWKTSPVIVTMNERLSSVSSVPFPSVTICPQNKVNPEHYNYTAKLKEMGKNNAKIDINEVLRFQHISFLCDDYFTLPLYQTEQYWDDSVIKDIIEAAPSINDIFFACMWLSKGIDCDKIFSKTLTRDGVCYTINGLAAKDIFEDTVQSKYSYIDSMDKQKGWSLENSYNNNQNDFFPRRGRVHGSYPDLCVILSHNPSKADKTCNNIYSGYKVYLHHPADFPQSSLYSYAALPNRESSMAISFHELNSDSSLIKYEPKVRQCYFPADRKLRYFKIYTLTNCQAECLSNFTYSQCGCVAYYMPHHNHSEICNFYNKNCKDCVTSAKDYLSERENNYMIPEEVKCNCLPACNTVEYDAEVLKTGFRMQEYFKAINNQMNFNLYDVSYPYSQVSLFYKKPQFVTVQRRELFGFTDLLANIGGLLGVFLGFSFLSLIELLYFLSVRLGFILKRDIEEEKAIENPK